MQKVHLKSHLKHNAHAMIVVKLHQPLCAKYFKIKKWT